MDEIWPQISQKSTTQPVDNCKTYNDICWSICVPINIYRTYNQFKNKKIEYDAKTGRVNSLHGVGCY